MTGETPEPGRAARPAAPLRGPARQVDIHLSHRHYHVPPRFRFVFQEPTGFATDGPVSMNRGLLPVTATGRCEPSAASFGHLGMAADVVLSTRDRQLGRGSVHWTTVRDTAYRRIHDEARALLPNGGPQADERPAHLFDHPIDRVPGMMSLAAFRQVGRRTAGGIRPGTHVRLTGLSRGSSPAANGMSRCFSSSDHISGDELSDRVRSIRSDRTAATGERILPINHHLFPGLVKRSGQPSHATFRFLNRMQRLPR